MPVIEITMNVGETIVLDCQLLSVVKNIGFVRVLHTAEPKYILPSWRHIYN